MNTLTIKTPFLISCKYYGLSLLAVICLVAFSACNDQANQHRQQSLDDMKAYVKAHKDSIDNYLDMSWDKLDQEFTQKKVVLENDVDKMNAEMKESYNNTLREWDSVKVDYTDRQAEKARLAHADKVMSNLYIKAPPSSAPRKLDFTDLSAVEIEPEYQTFVDVVRQYKDEYTTEDWTMVNKKWKDLNHRRKELKDSISMGDTKKILKLQIDYTAIKAVNRPLAVSDEDL